MKYYIVAGEASGDLHGSNLMKALRERDSQAEFRFWGGDLMEAVGGEMIKHYKDMAFMGFLEVALHLRQVLNNIKICEIDLLLYEPDVLILIDYPGFNLRIAEFAHEHGIKVVYYISPQVWAWKKNRIHKIKRCVDEMIVILPFEKEFYEKHLVPVHFVGHPLLDAIDSNIRALSLDTADAETPKERAPMYVFLLNWKSAYEPGLRGSYHSLDIPFVFNNPGDEPGGIDARDTDAAALAEIMSDAWVNFAKTGVPSAEGLPEWEPYCSETGATMIFDRECSLKHNFDRKLQDMLLSALQ